MKRRRKILLALLALLLLSQAPFVYTRLRLARLRSAVRELDSARRPAPPEDPFDEHAGVFHVHTALGGHSPGRPEELVAAAAENRLAFVVMTEHPAPGADTAAATLKGTHAGVLFVNGSELTGAGGGRLFVAPGLSSTLPTPAPLQELLAGAKAEGRLAVLGYPEEVRGPWPAGFDAVEVYNLYTNAKAAKGPRLYLEGLWSYPGYSDLLFATFYERPAEALRRWDETNAAGRARLNALAGNDAHANLGLDLGRRSGGRLPDLKLDPYELSFRLVRNHVLLERGTPLNADTLLRALRAGHSYIAFDLFADPTGFRFAADDGSGSNERIQGDEISLPVGGRVRLRARSPVKCRMLFFRDGQVFREVKETDEAEFSVGEAGVYRLELYLDQLGGLMADKPWVISNPVYVR
jgi:hypothetical protein